MAIYDWRGRNNRGEAVDGQLEAMTDGGVADQLKAIGVTPVHIALAASSFSSPLFAARLRPLTPHQPLPTSDQTSERHPWTTNSNELTTTKTPA